MTCIVSPAGYYSCTTKTTTTTRSQTPTTTATTSQPVATPTTTTSTSPTFIYGYASGGDVEIRGGKWEQYVHLPEDSGVFASSPVISVPSQHYAVFNVKVTHIGGLGARLIINVVLPEGGVISTRDTVIKEGQSLSIAISGVLASDPSRYFPQVRLLVSLIADRYAPSVVYADYSVSFQPLGTTPPETVSTTTGAVEKRYIDVQFLRIYASDPNDGSYDSDWKHADLKSELVASISPKLPASQLFVTVYYYVVRIGYVVPAGDNSPVVSKKIIVSGYEFAKKNVELTIDLPSSAGVTGLNIYGKYFDYTVNRENLIRASSPPVSVGSVSVNVATGYVSFVVRNNYV
jgi:hypothetical protein